MPTKIKNKTQFTTSRVWVDGIIELPLPNYVSQLATTIARAKEKSEKFNKSVSVVLAFVCLLKLIFHDFPLFHGSLFVAFVESWISINAMGFFHRISQSKGTMKRLGISKDNCDAIIALKWPLESPLSICFIKFNKAVIQTILCIGCSSRHQLGGENDRSEIAWISANEHLNSV